MFFRSISHHVYMILYRISFLYSLHYSKIYIDAYFIIIVGLVGYLYYLLHDCKLSLLQLFGGHHPVHVLFVLTILLWKNYFQNYTMSLITVVFFIGALHLFMTILFLQSSLQYHDQSSLNR